MKKQIPYLINLQRAQNIWIDAQKLNQVNPFGRGSNAVVKAIRHLGYVQIDAINVIERCHHHILYNRIPDYKTQYLHKAQTQDKSIFEYWTHALSYIATDDYKYFVRRMKNFKTNHWFSSVAESDYKKVQSLLKKGPIGIRDIKDDVLVEKTHLWGSQKPSKKALEFGFYNGAFTVSERDGILKKYDTTKRHFGWKTQPKAANERECLEYTLNRALRSQGIVSLDSICYLNNKIKKNIKTIIDQQVKKSELVSVQIESMPGSAFYVRPETLEQDLFESQLTHILSPFDPLVIQRKRLKAFFEYEHVFEVYIPKHKRQFGYFSLPVLHENKFVALLDLKADRLDRKILIQNWVWLKKYKSRSLKKNIENELHRFDKFQFDR